MHVRVAVDVFALGSFSDATQLKNNPICVASSKEPNVITSLLLDHAVMLQHFTSVNISSRNLLRGFHKTTYEMLRRVYMHQDLYMSMHLKEAIKLFFSPFGWTPQKLGSHQHLKVEKLFFIFLK
jgi:hypothetical protein